MDLLWPGLLGSSSLAFAAAYCPEAAGARAGECCRAWELNLLLGEAVMVRRLTRDVMAGEGAGGDARADEGQELVTRTRH